MHGGHTDFYGELILKAAAYLFEGETVFFFDKFLQEGTSAPIGFSEDFRSDEASAQLFPQFRDGRSETERNHMKLQIFPLFFLMNRFSGRN